MNILEQLEEQREGLVFQKERRDALLRLKDNLDFKKVIREGFLTEDCARFVRESINPQLNETERADALGFAQAAGYLKNWMNTQIRMGDVAEDTIHRVDESMDEVRAEQQDEED